jgi:transcriptional regulator GlxA family with amidase domain
MDRREAIGVLAGGGGMLAVSRGSRASSSSTNVGARPLEAPAKGSIPVAILISDGATVIDFAGPWEVFQDVHVPSRGETMDEQMPFQLFTVAESLDPVSASAGLKLLPNYTLKTAPAPKVVVVGAQRGRTPAIKEWLRAMAGSVDVLMSVCTGAFQLGYAGLLEGLEATTHHDFYDRLEREYPNVKLRRGLRFVEGPVISTAGGLTSGIDLALRVVERYFGRAVAKATAEYMEYESTSWIVA